MKKLMTGYALEHVEPVVFYVGKENIRFQKAVKKLGGEEITIPEFQHLVKDCESEITFRIRKENWKP